MPWKRVGEPMVGPPGTIDIGTVSMVAAGSPGSVVISGPPSARKANFVLPDKQREPKLEMVTVSGATTLAVNSEWTYVLSGSGVVELTALPGAMPILKLTSPMRVSGFSLAAGKWVGHLDNVGWEFREAGAPALGDIIPPTPGALAATLMDTTGLLRVTSASDDIVLNATPYRFSTDGGATWSAWQASASYELTGLVADTAYTFRHQVRDAASNVSSGTAVTASTTPAPTWTTRMSDTFTAPDGTTMASRTPDVGTAWGAGTAVIRGNKMTGTGLDNQLRNALWPTGSAITQRTRVQFAYSLPISPPHGASVNPYVGINGANNNFFNISMVQTNGGVKSISMAMYGGGATWSATQLVTTIPESGTFTFDYHPTRRVAVVRIDSTVVGFFSGGTDLPVYGFFPQINNNASMGNLKIEVSST